MSQGVWAAELGLEPWPLSSELCSCLKAGSLEGSELCVPRIFPAAVSAP